MCQDNLVSPAARTTTIYCRYGPKANISHWHSLAKKSRKSLGTHLFFDRLPTDFVYEHETKAIAFLRLLCSFSTVLSVPPRLCASALIRAILQLVPQLIAGHAKRG